MTKRNIFILAECYSIFVCFIFSKEIMVQLSHMVPADLSKAVLTTFIIALVTHLFSNVKSFHSEMFKNNTTETEGIKTGLTEVKQEVQIVKSEVRDVKLKVDYAVKEIDSQNQYKDTKKRRIQEFNDDWDAVKIDFYRLNNDDIIFYASLLKDCIRDFALEASSIAQELDKEKSMELLLERLSINLQNCVVTASSVVDEDFVHYFTNQNVENRNNIVKELENIMNGKLNNRAIYTSFIIM